MFLILSESLNLIGCQGDKVLSFVKYSKIFSKTIKGMKLILCIHDIYIILYINYVFCSTEMRTGCYGSVKFPLTYNVKFGICHLLLCYCRYFYKNVFGEVLSNNADVVQMSDFDWLSWQQSCLTFY